MSPLDQTAPSTAGTYYYGACVDSVTGESNTTNNCSSGVTVTVAVATAPDLVVGAPSVDDSSPTTGASFTLSATVRNQGSGSSAATTLRYYRSTDSSITSSDTAVGTDSVSGLSASGTSDESIDQTAPSTAGTYYYGACVDSVTGESNTTNNCSSGVTVTVAVARAGPGGWCAIGGRQQPNHRGVVHAERHGAQPGQRLVGRDHPALLPLHRLQHHVVGYGGRHRFCERTVGLGNQR